MRFVDVLPDSPGRRRGKAVVSEKVKEELRKNRGRWGMIRAGKDKKSMTANRVQAVNNNKKLRSEGYEFASRGGDLWGRYVGNPGSRRKKKR